MTVERHPLMERSSYYEADFCQDGYYYLNLFGPNSNGVQPLVIDSTSQIDTGLGQSNIIAVVASGDELDLYVNRQKIAGTKDNSFSHGSISVGALFQPEGSDHLCDVVYHNAKVWTF